LTRTPTPEKDSPDNTIHTAFIYRSASPDHFRPARPKNHSTSTPAARPSPENSTFRQKIRAKGKFGPDSFSPSGPMRFKIYDTISI
jgi:hypothetical protein